MRPATNLLPAHSVQSFLYSGLVGHIPDIPDGKGSDVVFFAPVYGRSADLVFQIPSTTLLPGKQLAFGTFESFAPTTALGTTSDLLLEVFEFLARLLSEGTQLTTGENAHLLAIGDGNRMDLSQIDASRCATLYRNWDNAIFDHFSFR